MPFTLVGWSESQETSGVLTNVAALADPHVRVIGDDIIIPRGLNRLAGIFAVGTTITLAQLVSPSLRRTLNLDITPLNVNAEPLVPTPWQNMLRNPIPLDEDEALNALVAEGAAAEQETVLAWLSDGPLQPVEGPIYTVRCTNATTLVAFAWTNGALTFSQSLPAGRYRIVGARAQSAGLIAYRFVFVGAPWRPGGIGYDAAGDKDDTQFRMGNMGVWGEFEHNIPPTVDFLSVSTDSAQVVHLDLQKVG